MITFFKNVKLFFKILCTYQWWDYKFLIEVNITLLKDMAKRHKENGISTASQSISNTINMLVSLLEKDIHTEARNLTKDITDLKDRQTKYENILWDHKYKIAKLLIGHSPKEEQEIEYKIEKAIKEGMSYEEAKLKYYDYFGLDKWWD